MTNFHTRKSEIRIVAAMAAAFWLTTLAEAQQREQEQPPQDSRQQTDQQQREDPQQTDRQQPGRQQQQRSELGVRMEPSETTGVLITEVGPGTTAEEAGIRRGDYILSVDDEPIDSPQALTEAIDRKDPGDEITLTIWRDSQRQQVTARLIATAPDGRAAQRPDLNDGQSTAWLGVLLEDAERAEVQGARIRSVYPSGPASRAGLRSGDVIVGVAGEDVASSQEAADQIMSLAPNEQVEIEVLRNGEERTIAVTTGTRDEFIDPQPMPEDEEYQEDGDPSDTIPDHAMMLEQHRRFAEQHQRIENLLLELQEDVRQLREELQESGRTGARPNN